METVLQTVVTVIAAIWKEANDAADNKEELLKLAKRTRDVIEPQLAEIRNKLTCKGYLSAPLDNLYVALISVQQLIKKRGQKRSVFMLPWDAFVGKGSKVCAEIQGAEMNLNQAMLDLMMGLQINAADVILDLKKTLDEDRKNANISVSAETKHPWDLKFSDLSYKKTARGKPKDVLGSGGFGMVFLASYQCDGKVAEVAVKEPHNPMDLHSDETIRKAFFREANNLYKLHHRNIVTFLGAIAVDDDQEPCYMLVTELLLVTLEKHLETAQHNDEKLLDIIIGMAEGLAYLHSMNIIHRDIKPQNIMLDASGAPKFIDFGLSKEKEGLQLSKATTRIGGTADWMSPEKKRGESSTKASDVYSFGLVCVNVLTLSKPPSSQSEREASVGHLDGGTICGQLVLCCTRDDATKRPTAATVATSLLIKQDFFKDEEKPRKEAEEKVRKEFEEKARKDAEEKTRKEAKEKMRKETEEKMRKEADEKARKEFEEKLRKEFEEKARKEAKEKMRKEAEEKTRKDAEEKMQKEAEEKMRKEAEEKMRKEIEEKMRTEVEEKMRKKFEEKMRKKTEEKARKEAEEKIRKEAEEKERKEAEKAQREAAVKVPRVAFVGMTNAGKSSLVNALYGTKCEVSAKECTMGFNVVRSMPNYDVVDVFGYNDERPYYTQEQIDRFLQLKTAVLLYTTSIQNCKRAIELFRAARVEVIVVRSKADKEEPEDLSEIEKSECKIAKGYGAAEWVTASVKQPWTLRNLLQIIEKQSGKATNTASGV